DVDTGASADAIEESGGRWQEGERELCAECQGARLNPVARAVRLRLFPLTPALSPGERVKLAAPLRKSSGRFSRKTLHDLFPLPGGEGRGRGKETTRLVGNPLFEAGLTTE